MRILQIKLRHFNPADTGKDWSLDFFYDAAGTDRTGMRHADPGLLDLMGVTLYGSDWPRACSWKETKAPCEAEILFEAVDSRGTTGRYRVRRELRHGGPAPAILERDSHEGSEQSPSLEELAGLPEAFMRRTLLDQRGFADLMALTSQDDRAAAFDRLTGAALYGKLSLLATRKYLALKKNKNKKEKDFAKESENESGHEAQPGQQDGQREKRDELARTLDELGAMERALTLRAEGLRQQRALRLSEDEIKELDRKREEWEKNRSLFTPMRQRLEKGRSALELGDDYASLREQRQRREQRRLEQLSLRESIAAARAELQSAEEAFTLMEANFRDKLAEQKRLVETAQNVQELDRQLLERQKAAGELQSRLESASRELKERSARVDSDRLNLEKTGLALREARKYLQVHAVDEKLAVGLIGIQKCFGLFTDAQERRSALKDGYARAIQKRQKAQSALNDRQALFSETAHRHTVIEKNYERARSFFEVSLKGKSLDAWRGLCAGYVKRLEAMEALSKKLIEARELRDRLLALRDRRLKMLQETRTLNIRDVEQAGRVEELQSEVQKLERRVALLRRIEDLDAVRELLQDDIPCPLCGAMTHPYVSGAVVPDAGETHRQLHEAQKALDELRDELSSRQTRAGRLSQDIESVGHEESEIRKNLNALGDEIAEQASSLGIAFGAGIPPLEELEQVRQKTRDQLQLSRNILETAENAERDMNAAADELEKIRESRDELTRFHQEALFQLQREKADEQRLEGEARSQEESFNSIRRELISQLSFYGYKNLPDENPASVIEALVKRSEDWREQQKRKEELERGLALAQASSNTLKKELDALKLSHGELTGRLRAVEAERDTIQQQRIILFASKDPATERERMDRDVEELRQQLEARRGLRAGSSARLQELVARLHTLETEMATGRERLQKDEVAFGKRLLETGFKNEDDYLSFCLPDEERRSLQARLKELTQADLEITAARENARALQLERQARAAQGQPENEEGGPAFLKRLMELNRKAGELYLSLGDDPDSERLYQEFAGSLTDRLRDPGPAGMSQKEQAEARELIFNAVLDGANARLANSPEETRLKAGPAPFELEDTEGRRPDMLLSSLAMAWGLADLFDENNEARELRLWDAGLDGAGPDDVRHAEELAGGLRHGGEPVLFSGS